jgi:hypothetical protein
VNNKHKNGKIKEEFVVKDVGVNSVYAYGWKLLAQLA